jgi:16S rRNA (guanine527-N7)-methyltransferase
LGVSRETLEGLGRRYGLPEAAAGQFERLLEALAAEPDPHTTVASPEAALDTHLADSLSGLTVEGLRRARRLADVGSGVGFPGLVLAVALPSTRVDLIESVGRKTAVAARLLQAADITNARALTARAEEWAGLAPGLGGGREAYDAVTARAVAPLAVLVEYAAPLLRVGGVLVAWKGARDAAEEEGGARAAERLQMAVRGVERVVPFEGAEHRHLHVFEKVGATPDSFPRRPGMARKRPLG